MLFKSLLIFCLLLAVADAGTAGLELPAPDLDRGRPLMRALNERRSLRNFADRPLSKRDLGDLLWAAFGINRREEAKRTAPSANNWQEIDIYVARADGLYLYDPAAHQLERVMDDDLRAYAGRQRFVRTAPQVLIYVADYDRMTHGDDDSKAVYAAADAAFISQNVYLFCASENLATVVIGAVDKENLGQRMRLRSSRHVIFTQPAGYPGD